METCIYKKNFLTKKKKGIYFLGGVFSIYHHHLEMMEWREAFLRMYVQNSRIRVSSRVIVKPRYDSATSTSNIFLSNRG